MVQMFQYLAAFLGEEGGQDIIEYSLLITFIAIACAAVVTTTGSAVTPIWSTSNTIESTANAMAGS